MQPWLQWYGFSHPPRSLVPATYRRKSLSLEQGSLGCNWILPLRPRLRLTCFPMTLVLLKLKDCSVLLNPLNLFILHFYESIHSISQLSSMLTVFLLCFRRSHLTVVGGSCCPVLNPPPHCSQHLVSGW